MTTFEAFDAELYMYRDSGSYPKHTFSTLGDGVGVGGRSVGVGEPLTNIWQAVNVNVHKIKIREHFFITVLNFSIQIQRIISDTFLKDSTHQ